MKKSIYGSILITLGVIGGCDKKNTLPDHYRPVPAGNTNVKFLTMSPDAPTVNYYVNGIKASGVAPSTTNAVQGFGYATIYPANIAYASFPAGAVKIDAKVPDSSKVMPGAVVSSNTQTFQTNKFYTYALVDSLSKISAFVVEDDPAVPDPAKAYFRIVNLIPNSGVKIEIIKTSTGNSFSSAFPNVAFKFATPFDTLGAGAGQVYKVFLKNPLTDAKLDSISAFAPTNTKKYTLYCYGVLGQTGTSNRRPIITQYTNF